MPQPALEEEATKSNREKTYEHYKAIKKESNLTIKNLPNVIIAKIVTITNLYSDLNIFLIPGKVL